MSYVISLISYHSRKTMIRLGFDSRSNTSNTTIETTIVNTLRIHFLVKIENKCYFRLIGDRKTFSIALRIGPQVTSLANKL